MASSLIGSLRVALSLGTADFEAGANKAAQISRRKSKEIEGAFAGAKTAIAGLFAAFSVGLLAEQIKKSLEYAGSLAEVSRTLGVTTKDLQTFRFAATQSGVAQDELEVGLRRLTVSMGKAELGSNAQAKAFGALGISLADLKGKSTGDVFRLMADGLSKISDRSQRAALEMALMGRSGSTLDNLLAPGAKRLNELADAAQHLGIVLSDSQIQGAEETAHKLDAVKQVLEAQIAGVVANNASAILSLSSALATLTGEIARFLGSNPQLALGIIGALLGGSRGGLPGAVIGGAAGAILGGKLAQASADGNSDLAFRTQQMRAAQQRYFSAQRATDTGDRAMPGIGVSLGGPGAVASARSEFVRQIKLLQEATAQAAARNAPHAPGVTVPKIFSGGGGARQKRAPTDRSDDVEYRFAQEELRADADILQAKMDLSHDIQERAALSLQMVDLEKQARDLDISHRVEQAKQDFAEHKITRATLDEVVAQAATLSAKGDEADLLRKQAIIEQRELDLANQVFQISDHSFQIREDILQKESNLAETAGERRKVELELLEIAYEQKRQALQHILDTSKDQAEITNARADLAALNANHQLDRQGVIQQTRGPLDQYMAGLPTSTAKWNEALQNVAVNGFGSLEQALMDTISGTKKLGDAFHEMAASILADLIKIAIQKFIIGTIMNLAGVGAGASAGGGFVPMSVDVSSGAPTSLPGFANGGSFVVGGNAGIDTNVLSLNNVPVARVSRGEPVSIANDNGGGRGRQPVVMQTFDLHGAVVTDDLLREMKAMSATAARDGARLGVIQMRDVNKRTFGKALKA